MTTDPRPDTATGPGADAGPDAGAIPADLPGAVAAFSAAVRHEGELLALAANSADLAAPLAWCPGWSVRDVVVHQGAVHRWASWHLRDRTRTRMPAEQRTALEAGVPGATPDLVAWFREGHATLLTDLAAADPADDGVWRFLPARSGAEFWSRRQAHETGIHRADVESAGGAITPYAPAVAADGIDELLLLVATRPGNGRHRRADAPPPATSPRPLTLTATDVDRTWRLSVGEQEITVVDVPEPGCELRGTASDLYLWAWNRLASEALAVTGDPTALARWAALAKVG